MTREEFRAAATRLCVPRVGRFVTVTEPGWWSGVEGTSGRYVIATPAVGRGVHMALVGEGATPEAALGDARSRGNANE